MRKLEEQEEILPTTFLFRVEAFFRWIRLFLSKINICTLKNQQIN